MFCDIVGFTAWSSVREPTQVFTLLEAIFTAFDDIAKQRGVFKVETGTWIDGSAQMTQIKSMHLTFNHPSLDVISWRLLRSVSLKLLTGDLWFHRSNTLHIYLPFAIWTDQCRWSTRPT